MTDANETDANKTYIEKIIGAIENTIKTNKGKIINNNNNSFQIMDSPSSPYLKFLKQIEIQNDIAIIVGHSQQIKQMHKELLGNKPNEQSETNVPNVPNIPNVYLFRHGHSCNNAKSKTKITDTMAAATLKKDWDPSLTTYGILTTLNIGMRNASILNQRIYSDNTLNIYVSQLIRTWETAFLLWLGIILKSYKNSVLNDVDIDKSTHTLKLHINELLNEHKFSVLGKEFDRGNAAENRQHQVILFKQFIKYILNNIITENKASVSVQHTISYELKGSDSIEEEDLINIVINFKDLQIKRKYLILLLQLSDKNTDSEQSANNSTSNSISFEQINKHNTYCIAFHLDDNSVLSSFKYHSGFEKFPNSLSNCEPLCYYDRGDLKKGKYTQKKYNPNKCKYDLDSFNDKKDTMNTKETRVHHFTRKIGTSIKNAIDKIQPTRKNSN